MNKRKILTLAMALCMVAILAIGGTLAYFTDTETYTNVMEIGDVEINIEELMKNPDFGKEGEDKYIKFDPSTFTLFPATNVKGVSLYNKMVSVFNNTEEYDAYIRTIVLIEKNADVKSCNDPCCVNGIHFAYTDGDYTTTANGKTYNGRGTTNYLLDETVTLDNGHEYNVVVFTDKDKRAVPAGYSQDSMSSVWLDANMTDEEAVAFGGDLEVIVLAQGIQAENLTHDEAMAALGTVNATNLKTWFGDITAADIATINDIY